MDLFSLIEEEDLQNLLLDARNHKSYQLKDSAFIATNTDTPEARESFFLLLLYYNRKEYSDKIQKTEDY